MNPGLQKLHDYPFEKLRNLRESVSLDSTHPIIDLSIGEPKTKLPEVVKEALLESIDQISVYPSTKGTESLRTSISKWISERFSIPQEFVRPSEHVLPVNGTREALFGITQALFERNPNRMYIAMPNPFYQIYEGAAFLAGAKPYYLTCEKELNFIPDWESINPSVWRQVSLIYICSPGNPSGAVFGTKDYDRLLKIADTHNFVVVCDECYSEIYRDDTNPPLGLLEWCVQAGRTNFEKCLVVNSLSKRSGIPGLRSGFIAGDSSLIEKFYKFRTYQGGAMSLQVQNASIAAWNDERHVTDNREYYRANMLASRNLLENANQPFPEAGFFLWLKLPIDDITATKTLLTEAKVLVLPGQFLGRSVHEKNPGEGYIRIALVPNKNVCEEALRHIKKLIFNGNV